MMGDTIRAEVRKIRTTRSALGLLMGMVALAGLATWGAVATASPAELATSLSKPNALLGIVIALPVFTAVLGIRSFTDEFRHGSIVPTFLATPERRRVLASKAIVVGIAAAGFAVAAMAAGIGTVLAYTTTHGVAVTVDAGLLATITAKAIVLGALWGVIGVAVGATVRHQVGAIVGLLLWMLIGEGLFSGAVPAVTRWLPAQSAVIGLGFDDGTVSVVAAATAVAWVVAALAVGAATLRRDVT
jgi:ABC-type transport system involved in multi-copper enzyme maturation permease subunit